MKVRNTDNREKIELQMTPMIDIVFQLLVFFIMTFKIVLPEGDFNIRMPLNAPTSGPPDESLVPPMKVRMTAGDNGVLTGLFLNDRKLKGFADLRNQLVSILGDERGPGTAAEDAEVELDCDYGLHYAYVIEAITSVSGYVNDEDKTIKMIEKIKFTPPEK